MVSSTLTWQDIKSRLALSMLSLSYLADMINAAIDYNKETALDISFIKAVAQNAEKDLYKVIILLEKISQYQETEGFI